MFKKRLAGKGLFVFSDPGGAKPCLSIATSLIGSEFLAISDRKYPFYQDFKCEVVIVTDDIGEVLKEFIPDFLFTGTSYTSNIEKKAIQLAKEKAIPCVSFVDHWTSIAARFKDEKGVLQLPNEVWVLDERAKQIAIEEGINEELLFISGNPYHVWLKKWKPEHNRETFLKKVNIKETQRIIILFAPDPLSNVNGIEAYGFDEYSASMTLLELVQNSELKIKKDLLFMVKMHPNQDQEKLIDILGTDSRFKILPNDVDVNEAIYHSDLVVGFFSSILIEASIMGKPVIRFLETELKNDPLLGLGLGTKANRDNLLKEILQLTA